MTPEQILKIVNMIEEVYEDLEKIKKALAMIAGELTEDN